MPTRKLLIFILYLLFSFYFSSFTTVPLLELNFTACRLSATWRKCFYTRVCARRCFLIYFISFIFDNRGRNEANNRGKSITHDVRVVTVAARLNRTRSDEGSSFRVSSARLGDVRRRVSPRVCRRRSTSLPSVPAHDSHMPRAVSLFLGCPSAVFSTLSFHVQTRIHPAREHQRQWSGVVRGLTILSMPLTRPSSLTLTEITKHIVVRRLSDIYLSLLPPAAAASNERHSNEKSELKKKK